MPEFYGIITPCCILRRKTNMKRLSFFLAIILMLFSVPFQVFAADSSPEVVIKYTVGSDETEIQATSQVIGSYWNRNANYEHGNAILFSLPYGAEIKSITWYERGAAIASTTAAIARFAKNGAKNYGTAPETFPFSDEENYLVDKEFINSNSNGYAQFVVDVNLNLNRLTLNEGFIFPENDVKGFVIRTQYQYNSKNYHDIAYVQISTFDSGSVSVDKTELKAQIDLVDEENEKNWHISDDRFNGKEYKLSGSFWADMKIEFVKANAAYDSTTASQDAVDTATYNLKQAIAKLIPASNVNATELYEEIIETPQKPLLYEDYTKASWNEYNSAKSSAEALLESLYDEGKPTTKNKSSDIALIAEIENESLILRAVRESMDPLLGYEDTGDVKVKYNAIRNLLRVYSPSVMENSLYTLDSYNNYLSQYAIAQVYIKNTPEPEGEAGKNQYVKVSNIYKQLWRAVNGLKDKNESITVTIKVVDSLALRLGKTLNEASGVHKLELSGDERTLNAAVDKLNNERLSKGYPEQTPTNYLFVTSINGILTTKGLDGWDNLVRGINPLDFKSPDNLNPDLEKTYLDVQLHDNDVITLAFLEQPTVPSSSGTGQDRVEENKFQEYYRQSSLLVDGNIADKTIEVTEGGELNLSAIYAMPHISTYSEGRTYPISGATLFVSTPSAIQGEIYPADINTGVVSDENGNMTYGFYEPGYYALSIHDLGANELKKKVVPGVTIGDTIYVHVIKATTEQLEKTRHDLKNKLQSLNNTYSEAFFTATDWESINNLFNKGMADVAGASDIKTMKSKYDTAYNGISEIHKRVTDENIALLSGFRSILSRLPDDVSLLGKSGEFLAKGLVERYAAMTEHQRSLLTGIETNKYAAVKTAYEKGLHELAPYELTLKLEADSEEAKSALEDMITYIQVNGKEANTLYKYDVTIRNIEGNTAGRMSFMSAATSPSAIDGELYSEVSTGAAMRAFAAVSDVLHASSAYPDNYVSFAPTVDRFIYNIAGNITTGNDWIIIDDDESFDNTLIKGRTVLITGIPYEIKSIKVSGIDLLNYDDYKADTQVFPDAQNNFIMPYSDVEVAVKWGPVDENANPEPNPELAIAKATAIAAVKNAFSQYKSNEYADGGWSKLLAARDTGIAEINAAKTVEAISAAKDRAIAAMEAVAKKTIAGEIPDFGKKLGTVDVYVENTTFPGGAFKGNIVSEPGFEYAEKDTMMTVVLRALQINGFSWTGQGGDNQNSEYDYTIEYIATIEKDGKSLGEFSGEPGSGWMGTLNDFFVNEGFQHFIPSEGDEIRVMFTQKLGEDLGGTWGNSDTSLKDLEVSGGKLYPTFSSGNYGYTLMVPSSTGKVKVTPTASNKNYLVKIFLNDKVTSNKEGASFYKRTQNIPVKSGDYINIGVGEYAWPSMNNQETEARNYTGTWYRLDIISADKGADRVISLINALPSVKRIDLSHEDEVKSIRSIYSALIPSEQAKVTNIDKLKEAEARIEFVRQIENVKTLLEKIPAASKVTLKDKQTVMDADAAYKKLTDEQRLYITVGDVKNYNDAIDKLTELGAFSSGGAPSKIVGSDAVPVIEGGTIDVKAETKVVNKEATSKVTDKQIKEALEEAEKAEDVSSITIKAETKEEVNKTTVSVPKSSVSEITGARLDLKVETPLGTISMPVKALTEIARQAQGSSVEIVVENMAAERLTDEQKAATEGSIVYDISIISGGQKISSFGGQKITVSLPYTLKAGEKAENVTVWYMNNKGELEKISCSYNEKTGLATFTTDHLSYYVVGYENKISFADVTENDWFYEYVMYAVQKGLFSGTGENTFSPNRSMTRSMLVTVLHRLEGKPAASKAAAFSDVPAGQWYTDAVSWSLEKEIIKGITETEFKPESNITREQLAVMLYRYASTKNMVSGEGGSTDSFTDKDKVSSWAETAVKWAVGKGIITGRTNGSLDPSGSATRAEVAAMLQRYIENVK